MLYPLYYLSAPLQLYFKAWKALELISQFTDKQREVQNKMATCKHQEKDPEIRRLSLRPTSLGPSSGVENSFCFHTSLPQIWENADLGCKLGPEGLGAEPVSNKWVEPVHL